MSISNRRILVWAPRIFTFVLANGFLEELMFRGLFLRKFEPLLGAPLANFLTGFVFAVGHAGVTYTADILGGEVDVFSVWGDVFRLRPSDRGHGAVPFLIAMCHAPSHARNGSPSRQDTRCPVLPFPALVAVAH